METCLSRRNAVNAASKRYIHNDPIAVHEMYSLLLALRCHASESARVVVRYEPLRRLIANHLIAKEIHFPCADLPDIDTAVIVALEQGLPLRIATSKSIRLGSTLNVPAGKALEIKADPSIHVRFLQGESMRSFVHLHEGADFQIHGVTIKCESVVNQVVYFGGNNCRFRAFSCRFLRSDTDGNNNFSEAARLPRGKHFIGNSLKLVACEVTKIHGIGRDAGLLELHGCKLDGAGTSHSGVSVQGFARVACCQISNYGIGLNVFRALRDGDAVQVYVRRSKFLCNSIGIGAYGQPELHCTANAFLNNGTDFSEHALSMMLEQLERDRIRKGSTCKSCSAQDRGQKLAKTSASKRGVAGGQSSCAVRPPGGAAIAQPPSSKQLSLRVQSMHSTSDGHRRALRVIQPTAANNS